MKIVIAHGQTKRVIEGEFEICLSGNDLKRLVRILTDHTKANPDFNYGWIEVHDPLDQTHFVNTKAKDWDE